MPLRQKHKVVQAVQPQSCMEINNTVININKEEPCPKTVVNISENKDDSQKLLTFIPKVQHFIILHSENLNIPISDVQKDRQQLVPADCDVVKNLGEPYPEITKVNENQGNSHLPCASILRRQRKTKFGTLQSGLLDISINNKEETNDPKRTKELNHAREYIKKLKKKLDSSQHKYKRLQEKATSLAFLVKQLRSKEGLPEDTAKLLEK